MYRLALAVLCALAGNAALAQGDYARHEFFGEAGGSFYSGHRGPAMALVGPLNNLQFVPIIAQSEFSKSFRLAGGYRYWLAEKEAVEFTFSFSANRIRVRETSAGPQIQFPLSWQTDMRNIAANYVRKLPNLKRLELFVTAGVGIGIFLEPSEGAEVKFVVNYGAGVDVRVSPRWLFRVEVRDYFSAQPSGGSRWSEQLPQGVTHGIVPTAGFVFRF